MICFPNAKINLGLHVTEKRMDGFHNIETVFYPVGWNDALEIMEVPSNQKEFDLHVTGKAIAGNIEDNLLYKAYQLIKQRKTLPHIAVYLYKALPMGAGLGGGSADAAFFINQLDLQLSLNFKEEEKRQLAAQLGSDCAFFIKNKPVFASGKGDVFQDLDLDLSTYHIAIIYPNIHSNTKEAYSLVTPAAPRHTILETIHNPVHEWKDLLVNDFENSIFSLYPVVEQTKLALYGAGALYASMSGSGSAVFGLFESEPIISPGLLNYPHWIGKMG